METFLYILPFKDKKYFKVGISQSLSSRVSKLDRTHNIILEEALIVRAYKNTYIKSLEYELLELLERPILNHTKDGSTEIRLMSDYDKCIDYINDKHELFRFRFEPFDNNKSKSTKKRVERVESNIVVKAKKTITKKNKPIVGNSLSKLLDAIPNDSVSQINPIDLLNNNRSRGKIKKTSLSRGLSALLEGDKIVDKTSEKYQREKTNAIKRGGLAALLYID